jgi:hypothetical protein
MIAKSCHSGRCGVRKRRQNGSARAPNGSILLDFAVFLDRAAGMQLAY